MNEIRDLLYISYRKKKQIASLNLIEQINTWTNVKNIRHYPFKFNSFEEYSEFKTNFKELVEEWLLPSNDIRIQGSSIRTSAAADLDIAIVIDREAFQSVREDILFRYRRSFINAKGVFYESDYNNAVLLLDQAAAKGIIKSRPFGVIGVGPAGTKPISFSQDLYEIKQIYPRRQAINISIIIKNGNFDISPYLKF